jgi:hypothetical protein
MKTGAESPATTPPVMTTAIAQALSVAKLDNVEVNNGCIWVYGCDYIVAAVPTRRSFFWQVTDMDAQEEIGGSFSTARAAVEFALSRGPLA